jgi:hypothetical protein
MQVQILSRTGLKQAITAGCRPKIDKLATRTVIKLGASKSLMLPRPAMSVKACRYPANYLSSDTTHSTMTARRQALPASSSATRASFPMASPRF